MQAQHLAWARQLGGSNFEHGYAVTVDGAGNVYSTGDFNGTIDLDPGAGVFSFNYTGAGPANTYISKLDANGNFVWAKQIEGWGNHSSSIAVDVNGNVFVTGIFLQNSDLDPGPGVFTLTAGSSSAVYILKLNSNGDFVWAGKIGDIDNLQPSWSNSIKLDGSGNIHVCGVIRTTTDFDPGPGSFPLSPTGQENAFILKLDNAGNFIWAKVITGTQSSEPYEMAVDAGGKVYTTGYFRGTFDFDPGAGTQSISSTVGDRDAYILKLDENGNFVWVKRVGAFSIEWGNAIAIDPSGNIVIAGEYIGTVDFDPGAGVFNLTSNGDYRDIFLLKLDNTGNFLWAGTVGGSDHESCDGIGTDALGNIYLAGAFAGVADLNPGSGITNVTAAGGYDIFISKIDVSGALTWVIRVGNANTERVLSLTADAAGTVYGTGFFGGTVDFDPGLGTVNLVGVAGADAHVFKLRGCFGSTTSTVYATACNSYTLNGHTYTATGIYQQTILNTAGCDSIITLNLTIGGSVSTSSVTACDSYTWQGNTYTTGGIYSVTLTGAGGCDSVLNLVLTIKNSLATTVNATICEGQLYAGHSASGIYIDTYMAVNGCDSIRTLHLLVKPKSVLSLVATICGGENYLGYTSTGIYRDTLTAANGCDSIRVLNLTVNPTKITTINADICIGQSYTAGGADQTITGVYYDTLQTYLGCDSIIVTNLTVHQKPLPNLGADRNLCSGVPLNLDPGVFQEYLWQDLSTGSVLNVSGIGTYWVTVTDLYGCKATDSIKILNIVLPPSGFLKPTDSICRYETLSLTGSPGYVNYNWSNGSTNAVTEITSPGDYTLTVTNSDGCSATETIKIYPRDCLGVIFFPSAFTPNSDQLNNLFRPIVRGRLLSYRLEVYNREGQLIFRSNEPEKGWDGTFRGSPLGTAVFVWQCSYQLIGSEPAYKRGTIMLIR